MAGHPVDYNIFGNQATTPRSGGVLDLNFGNTIGTPGATATAPTQAIPFNATGGAVNNGGFGGLDFSSIGAFGDSIGGGISSLFGGGSGLTGGGEIGGLGSLGGAGGFGGAVSNAGDVLGLVTGIMGAVNAGKERKQAQEIFDFKKDAFNQNTALQAQSLNTQLEDRQLARQGFAGKANSDNTYGSLESYLEKNSIKPKKLG